MGYELRRWLADRLPAGLSSGERLVALEIADQANDATRLAYGRDLLEVVARRTGFSSTKQVRKVLTKLSASKVELRVPILGGDGRPLIGADGRTMFAREGRETTYRIPTVAECPALEDPPRGALVSEAATAGPPSGSPQGADMPEPDATSAPADENEGPPAGTGGPPLGDMRAPAGGHEGPRWGAPSPQVSSEPLKNSPQKDQSPVLAVGELQDRNGRESRSAPSAQPKDHSFACRALIHAIPRYRDAPGWVRKQLIRVARAALNSGLGWDAIERYATLVIAEQTFDDHHHIPELRHALARLSRDVALGDACPVHGLPECPVCVQVEDRPWTADDQADLEAAIERLGLAPDDYARLAEGGT